jgi:nitrogen fixation NifU-like protein
VADSRALYEQVILDHNRNPRNFREIANPSLQARGYNPLCGDQLTVYVRMAGDRIADVAFQGSGCAISKSSASMMTDALKGKLKTEAATLFATFCRMATSEPNAAVPEDALGRLAAFRGVREYPVRVQCATLPWHTLMAALEGREEPASTE